MLFFNRKFLAMVGMLAFACGCAEDIQVEPETVKSPVITAYVDETPCTRACITSEITSSTRYVPVLWMPDDALGVFTDSENNVKYSKAELTANHSVASFSTVETVTSTPAYAYYPYSAEAGTDKEALLGEIPQVQSINLISGMISGDYKVGEYKTSTTSGVQFRFTHMFSPVRIMIDGVGTALAEDNVLGVDLTVTRNGEAVPVSGGFTFSAVDGSYVLGATTNSVSFDFPTSPALNETTTGYATVFPEIKKGDQMAFTIRTSGHTATFSVTAKVDFVKNTIYTFPLTLSDFADSMTVAERSDVALTGTFTCATYNIKGSSDATIGTMIANDAWDFFNFCECGGGYTTNLNAYSFGSKSETLGDLLYFGALTETCSLSGEYIDAYDEEYGSILGGGTNTEVTKGFRYYLVTFKNGVQVDVYITHMNTYKDGSQEHLDCQHAQLKEVATWIANHRNGRPVIFMGDTNCRYTRHDFETYFWSIISEEGITISDPWVEYWWNGEYPTYDTNSLVVADATGTSDTDIIYSSQQGEVVDKIIYINDANADTQIKATSYLRDMDYSGLSDHMPIVVEFYYEKTN